MTIGYTEIQFGDVKLNLIKVNKKKVPGTIKQKVGFNLVKHKVPGLSNYDWEISGNGVIYETSTAATTTRIALEALNDIAKHNYSDGLIIGSFIMESLSFPDEADNPLHYTYNIKLVEYNQP